MRDQLRKFAVYLILAALVAVVPVGIARHLLSESRSDAYIPNGPNYLAHQYPPSGKADLSKKLAGLLETDMHQVGSVPRIYLSHLPEALPNLTSVQEKKRIFTSAMLPIILRANELIIADRGRLLEILNKRRSGKHLAKTESKWLKKVSKKYRVPLAVTPTPENIETLLYKIDVVPVSLALAQAAMETGWGTHRFAQECNALFGEWVFEKSAKGCVPGRRDEGKNHKIKSFDYLLESVSSYMTNLNCHRSYEDLRRRRAELRRHSLAVTGNALAPALVDYSEIGTTYVNNILSIISYNDLGALDFAQLTNS